MTPEQEARLKKVEDWMKARQEQQITLPLDETSLKILEEFFVRFQDTVAFDFVGASSHVVPIYFGQQGNRTFEMSSTYIRCTANPDNNRITVSNQNQFNKVFDGTRITFAVDELTGGVLPGGLTTGFGDFVVANASADGYSFELEAFGGGPIDITSIGEGKLFFYIYF